MRPVIIYYTNSKGTQFWDCKNGCDLADDLIMDLSAFDIYVHYFSFPLDFWKGGHTVDDVCRNIGLNHTYPFMVSPTILVELALLLKVGETRVGETSVDTLLETLVNFDFGFTPALIQTMLPILQCVMKV